MKFQFCPNDSFKKGSSPSNKGQTRSSVAKPSLRLPGRDHLARATGGEEAEKGSGGHGGASCVSDADQGSFLRRQRRLPYLDAVN